MEFGLLVLASSDFVAIVAYANISMRYQIITPLKATYIMLNIYRRGEGKCNKQNYI
jgi:hypothetical protein